MIFFLPYSFVLIQLALLLHVIRMQSLVWGLVNEAPQRWSGDIKWKRKEEEEEETAARILFIENGIPHPPHS